MLHWHAHVLGMVRAINLPTCMQYSSAFGQHIRCIHSGKQPDIPLQNRNWAPYSLLHFYLYIFTRDQLADRPPPKDAPRLPPSPSAAECKLRVGGADVRK
jgi:hypothetical protein